MREVASWLCRDYESTRNPLDLWQAYQLARDGKGPLPPAVLDYFDRVAYRLGWMTLIGFVPDNREGPGAVFEALELKRPGRTGATNRFRKNLRESHEIEIAAEVAAEYRSLRQNESMSWRLLIDRHHPRCTLCRNRRSPLSEGSVKAYWQKHKHLFE